MKKWFVRVLVALIAFMFSVALTGALRFFFGGPVTNAVTVVTDSRPFMDFTLDHAQIAEIYEQYGAAQTRHNRAFFERVEDENFMLFVGSERFTREQDIQWMERQPTDITYELRVNHIRVFGDSAVARGRLLVTDGDGLTTESPFIDVWLNRAGTWRIQSTTSIDETFANEPR